MDTILEIPPGESYSGIRAFVDLSMCVKYTNNELEQSSYVMNLAYRTLYLIIHTMYMERIRSKLRCRFIVPSGLPKSYAC